jgi:hypothetical protein
MNLPDSKDLPIHHLAASFNNTSASYKFYWLLSIIQAVENGKTIIPKRELFSGMISNAWYTVNYFKVSYGKQDLIHDTIRSIKVIEDITIDEKRETVYKKLVNSTNNATEKILKHYDKNVPHWFLSTWFPKQESETYATRKKRIYFSSKNFELKCLYALHQDHIELNPEWRNYLISNAGILKDFCFWNLALYLQSKNPNVPDIPNKLIKTGIRNSLTKQRKEFWDLVFDELGSVICIYTGNELSKDNYAVEHFIPYSFVSHDLIWNLIPADKSFNSSKSDKLPPLEKYFNSFFDLQITAIEIVKDKYPKNKLLEDYLTIFPDLDKNFSKEKFKESIQPLVTIASNNGFEFLK